MDRERLWAEVELAVGDGDDNFAAHDLAFVVGVGVVFSSAVVEIAAFGRVAAGVEGHEVFQPTFVVGVQSGFVVVDENTGGDVRFVLKSGVFEGHINKTFAQAGN